MRVLCLNLCRAMRADRHAAPVYPREPREPARQPRRALGSEPGTPENPAKMWESLMTESRSYVTESL